MAFLITIASGLFVYIVVTVYNSVKTHKVKTTFNKIICKCTHCHTITSITNYKYVKIYKLLQEQVIESYFVCPDCHARYNVLDDVPLYSYENHILEHK